jgi:tripartite ATP-independent transporter DctP family solute receptor
MRRLIPLIAALALTLAPALPARASDAPSFTIRFNTVASPQQPQVKGLEVFRRELERLSGGKIRVKIFHSGQLGDQQTQTLGVMRGTLDMTFTDPNTTAQFDPRVGIFGAAYLFRDIPQMYRVMEGPVGAGYFDRLATERGMRPLGVWYLGTRELNLRDRAVRTPAEMRGIKLRMPNSPSWIAMGRALGASPTPLGFGEVYLALKTGVVDGQDNPLPTDKAQKFHEVTRYIVLTHHQIGMLWPTINERLWQRMPAEYRSWVMQALRAGREHQNKLVLDGEAALIAEFRDVHGMTIVEPDVEAFRAHAREVYREFEGEWGAGMYDRIRAVP